MAKGPDFLKRTKQTLASRAGQVCSNPKCRKPTSGPHSDKNKALNLGEAAHIRAARKNQARYDPNMTDEERRDISNGIWLCIECARRIDRDEAQFSVELLMQWKEQHEKWISEGKPDDAIRFSSNQDSQSAGRHVAWTINVGDHIVSHREIAEGSYLESNNNRYKLVVQGDGNLVIYEGAIPVWATGTDGKGVPPFKLAMQGDGNLVMYDGNGKPTWDSKTNAKGRGPFRLTMQDDRNIVIYDSQGKSTWASNTSL